MTVRAIYVAGHMDLESHRTCIKIQEGVGGIIDAEPTTPPELAALISPAHSQGVSHHARQPAWCTPCSTSASTAPSTEEMAEMYDALSRDCVLPSQGKMEG
ncbi:hypothetical protein BDZ97DRAFT_1761111 [Flammula alnicola]|nr:hypothetical protein BDZ97DRAFT_1761111 [Flammula alnicola]